jgi:hypothetical protein
MDEPTDVITQGGPREVAALVERIRPILAGHSPEIQGGALADCLAIWLAGHVAADKDATDVLRNQILFQHVAAVQQLIPINARIIGTTP